MFAPWCRAARRMTAVNNDLPIPGPNVLPPLDEFKVRVVPVPPAPAPPAAKSRAALHPLVARLIDNLNKEN